MSKLGLVLLLVFSGATAESQDKKAPLPSIPTLIRNSKPAIVGIAALYNQPISGITRLEVTTPDHKTLYAALSGSGFVVSPDGFIVTADHVIRGLAPDHVCVYIEREVIDAKVISEQPEHDVAILKINRKKLPYLRFGKYSEVVEGQDLIFMGHPFGEPAVTSMKGMVAYSGSGKPLNQDSEENYMELDARVNGGNSGGPLIDISDGTVVGIIEAKYGQISEYLKSLEGAKGGAGFIASGGVAVDVEQFAGDVASALDRNLQVGIGFAISAEYAEAALKNVQAKPN